MIEAVRELEEKYFIIHQTGEKDEAFVKKEYESIGIKSLVQAFFNDMEVQYAKADLVVARAGATTVAELIATNLPAIFIPFPFASDNHQFFNAKAICDCGCAKIIIEKNLKEKKLSKTIKDVTQNLEEFQNNYKKMKYTYKRADIKNDAYPQHIKYKNELNKKIKEENASKIIVDDIIRLITK